jgi:hypothetical protein
MSDMVLIATVIGVVVVLVVLLLRGRLAGWDASWKGVKTRLTAHPVAPEPGSQAGTLVSGNQQSGEGNQIDLERDAVVRENTQRGRGNTIAVRSDGGAPPP